MRSVTSEQKHAESYTHRERRNTSYIKQPHQESQSMEEPSASWDAPWQAQPIAAELKRWIRVSKPDLLQGLLERKVWSRIWKVEKVSASWSQVRNRLHWEGPDNWRVCLLKPNWEGSEDFHPHSDGSDETPWHSYKNGSSVVLVLVGRWSAEVSGGFFTT